MSFRGFSLYCLVLLFAWIHCHAVCVNCPSAQVRFVNNTNSSMGTGTYADPYNNLHFALQQSNPCDVIYVFPSPMSYDTFNTISMTTSPFTLKDNQRLLSTTAEAFQRCPFECALPSLTNTGGAGVVVFLANNNEVSGFQIDVGNGSNSGIAGISVASAKITNNVITTRRGGSCVIIFNSFNGTITVSNCFFYGADATSTNGVVFFNNNNVNVEVFENWIGGTGPGVGLLNGFFTLQSNGGQKVHVHNNTLIMQNGQTTSSDSTAGIVVYPQAPSSGNTFALIEHNSINTLGAGLQGVGVGILNDVRSDNICVILENNTSITPNGTPGYFITNFSTKGRIFLDFDNSNEGSAALNLITPNLNQTIPPTGLQPVIFSPDCR